MSLLLWTRRRDIKARQTRGGDASLDSLSFLFRMYSPRYYYMSIVDMIRRLALTSFLIFFGPGYQIMLALAVSIVATVAMRELSPFHEEDHNSIELVNYICGWETVLCIMSLAFMDLQAAEVFHMNEDLVR